jgi:TonB family protein
MTTKAVILLFALLSVALISAFGTARASDDCPANIGHFIPTSPTRYAFDIESEKAGTLQGTIAVQTEGGWFRIPFPAVVLKSTTWHDRDSTGQMVPWGIFASPIMLAAFPTPVRIENYWVEIIEPKGGTPDSDSKGQYHCEPGTLGRIAPGSSFVEQRQFSQADAGSSTAIAAQPVPPIERTDCLEPMREAVVVTKASPEISPLIRKAGMPLTTEVEILVGPNGSVEKATVRKSSGSAVFDDAAVTAANETKASPKLVYCKPAFGLYVITETFTP